MGKTALLRFLAWKATHDPSCFPVFASLPTIQLDGEGPLLVRALDWCLRWLQTSDIGDLDDLRALYLRRLLQGRAVVILDGLEELEPGVRATLMDLIREGDRANFGGNTVVLSSRKPDSVSSIIGASLYQIMPFTPQQMRELVVRLIPDPEIAKQVVSTLATVLDTGLAAQSVGWLQLVARLSVERQLRRGSALDVLSDVVEIGLRGMRWTPIVRQPEPCFKV
jgi:hypothetical protein